MTQRSYQNIIVDGNALAYRIFSSNPGFSDARFNENIGLYVHNFLTQLIKITTNLKFDNIIFCWDSPVNKRKQIDKRYKANRKAVKEKDKIRKERFISLITKFRKDFSTLGLWADMEEEGYEGDDLLAYFAEQSKSALIVTSDNDLYQTLTDNVDIYILHDKIIYTQDDFILDYGIKPYEWSWAKAIAGDTSDNIIGLKGVGIKTALKYLIDETTLSENKLSLIRNNYDIVKFNLDLTFLPLDNDIRLKTPQRVWIHEAWVDLFQKYSLRKLDLMQFKAIFTKG